MADCGAGRVGGQRIRPHRVGEGWGDIGALAA